MSPRFSKIHCNYVARAGRFKTGLEGQQRILLRKSVTAASILRPSKILWKKIQLPVKPTNGNISLYHSPSPWQLFIYYFSEVFFQTFLSLDLPRQCELPHVSCWLILKIHSPPSRLRLLSALLDQTLGSSFITAKVFHNLWSFITPNASQFLSHAFRNLHTRHVFNLIHLE